MVDQHWGRLTVPVYPAIALLYLFVPDLVMDEPVAVVVSQCPLSASVASRIRTGDNFGE
jgi:hypothetical protein